MRDEESRHALEALVSLSAPVGSDSESNEPPRDVKEEKKEDDRSTSPDNESGAKRPNTLQAFHAEHEEDGPRERKRSKKSKKPDPSTLQGFHAMFDEPQQQVPDGSTLKCKYRTGKCHNMRALKYCGEYHNLCNYHRLRANANQRKLDRKKKELRSKQQKEEQDKKELETLHTDALVPVGIQVGATTPSSAAAAALASLPMASLPSGTQATYEMTPPLSTTQRSV